MSKTAELQERVDYLEGEVEALDDEVEDLKKKAAKSASSYKSKLKNQAKQLEAARQKALEEATGVADELTENAKAVLLAARQESNDPTKGIAAKARAEARAELVEELFDVD